MCLPLFQRAHHIERCCAKNRHTPTTRRGCSVFSVSETGRCLRSAPGQLSPLTAIGKIGTVKFERMAARERTIRLLPARRSHSDSRIHCPIAATQMQLSGSQRYRFSWSRTFSFLRVHGRTWRELRWTRFEPLLPDGRVHFKYDPRLRIGAPMDTNGYLWLARHTYQFR